MEGVNIDLRTLLTSHRLTSSSRAGMFCGAVIGKTKIQSLNYTSC